MVEKNTVIYQKKTVLEFYGFRSSLLFKSTQSIPVVLASVILHLNSCFNRILKPQLIKSERLNTTIKKPIFLYLRGISSHFFPYLGIHSTFHSYFRNRFLSSSFYQNKPNHQQDVTSKPKKTRNFFPVYLVFVSLLGVTSLVFPMIFWLPNKASKEAKDIGCS